MNDSSAGADNLFAGLRLHNVGTLIDVCEVLQLADVEYVRRRYNERATDFEATVDSLAWLGLISRDGSAISLVRRTDDELRRRDLGRWLVGRIVESPAFYERACAYLGAFRVSDGQRFTWRAGATSSDHFPDVRDVLMDCGAVYFDRATSTYHLASGFSHLLALSELRGSAISPAMLRETLAANDDIGWRVELAALEFEKRRVGASFEHRVIHTSAFNVAAGFDLESVTVVDSWPLPRYIEVKAVSSEDFRFYWTANEMRVARLFSERYFLYLVPISANGLPQFDTMIVIQDPCTVVLAVESKWAVVPDVLACCLKSTMPSECSKSEGSHA